MTVGAALGNHILVDLYGVGAAMLRDAAALEAVMRNAALVANARVLASHFHSFGEGAGVTGVLLLAESHVSIHTWPEFAFAAADIFMCGTADSSRALDVLLAGLAPLRHHVTTRVRGNKGNESHEPQH